MLQYREVIGGEVRTVGDEDAHQIEAKVCSYGVAPDTYNTTWQRGCFDGGLRDAKPAVCWSHKPDSIIGSVVDYTDNPDGLYVRMQLADFDAVPDAKRAYSLVKDGHVRGWSFGFTDGETEPDPDHKGALRFRAARMYEVSPVLRASVPLTRTVSVRTADGEAEAATDMDLEAVVAAGIRSALDTGKPLDIGTKPDEGTSVGTVYVDVKPRVDTDLIRSAVEGATDPDNPPAEFPDVTALIRAIDEAQVHALTLHTTDDDLRSVLEAVGEATATLCETLGVERAAKKPYGDVAYADEKNSKYPIDSEEHVRAAWAYINKPENAAKYPLNGVTLAEVKAKIQAAAKKLGIDTQGRSDDEAETRVVEELDDDLLTSLTLLGMR